MMTLSAVCSLVSHAQTLQTDTKSEQMSAIIEQEGQCAEDSK